MNRWQFLRSLLAAVASIWTRPGAIIPAVPREYAPGDLPKRDLGKTGLRVSILAPGGYHIGRVRSTRSAIHFIHRAIDEGINFLDTAESYQNGGSERIIGEALKDRRDKVILMTKTYEPARRDAEGARKHLEGSLRRLQTDYLDLWQLHSIQSPEDVDRAFRPGGAMEFILRAREEGKVRFVGVTGHRDPQAHLRAIHYWDQGWRFDAMQMPVNPMDYHQKSFQRQVLPELVKRGIGVIAMKTSADGRLLREGLCTVDECLTYVWSLPVAVAVVGMTNENELAHNLQLARHFRPLPDSRRQQLLRRLASHARLELEWYKR